MLKESLSIRFLSNIKAAEVSMELTYEKFIERLVEAGWTKDEAKKEWQRIQTEEPD